MKDAALLKATAMFCITAAYVCAALQGYDGILFATVVAALAGLGGYEIGRRKTYHST